MKVPWDLSSLAGYCLLGLPLGGCGGLPLGGLGLRTGSGCLPEGELHIHKVCKCLRGVKSWAVLASNGYKGMSEHASTSPGGEEGRPDS